MHAASRALAAGADFTLLGPARTMLAESPAGPRRRRDPDRRRQEPDHALPGRAARRARPHARSSSAIRCRTATWSRSASSAIATYEDLDRYETTIEEREEYEPHLDAGRVVYAGVDYEAILREAELEADVILWDGGNNDFPFYRPDLFIVVADPLRPGDELHYHPGETNVRMADVVIINKIDSAEPAAIDAVRAHDRAS